MKSKYIKFFKKEMVFLLVLLIVVCVSFGMTYANFIYNSDNKRAVEMFAGALSYNMKINGNYQNNIDLLPGSQIIDLEIESTNEISSYYKLLANKNITIYSMDGITKGVIGSTDIINIKLYIVNNTNEIMNISFMVSMGYLTNTLDDVIVNEGYYEIENIKKEITYDNKKWSIVSINDDASIDLISKDVVNVKLSGYNSYNNLSSLLDSKCTTSGSRSLNAFDIEEINIIVNEDNTTVNRLTYYPSSLKNEEYIQTENEVNENGYSYASKISLRNKQIYSNIINESFKQNKYVLNTNYYEIINNEIFYYVIEVNNGIVNLKKIYDSNNTNYEITTGVKCIVNIRNVTF